VYNIIIEGVDTPLTAKVNYAFYELECYKLIQGIEFSQMKIF